MSENVVLWILCFSVAATFLFVYGIVDDLFYQCRRKNKLEKLLAPVSPPLIDAPPVEVAIQKPVTRSFDTPELFREDALIRIHELKREIAADLAEEACSKLFKK